MVDSVRWLAAAALIVAVQGANSSPQRLGPTGLKLTPVDLREIQKLTIQRGRTWVLIGQWPERARPNQWPVDAFFEPDVVTPAIRRGDAAMLLGALAPNRQRRPPICGQMRGN